MSVVPTANVPQFYRRMSRIYDAWDEHLQVDAIVILVGALEGASEYCKTHTMQQWLFNIEIADALMVFGRSSIFFMATKKKIDFLKPLQDKAPSGTNVPKIELLTRNKGQSNDDNFDTILKSIKAKKLGYFPKDKYSGDFYKECVEKIFKKDHGIDAQDVTAPMSYILAIKEDSEIQLIQKACNASETTYSNVLCKELTAVIDKEKKVSHSRVTNKLNDGITKGRFEGLDNNLVDTCYAPILQSGGSYALKFATTSNDDNIHYGVIVSSLGVRYKKYCSNVSRTLLVDPTDEQKKNYEFLLEAADELIKRLTDGIVLSDLYDQVVKFVERQRPDLVDKMTKNFGFATGLEFREAHMVIGPKTSYKASKNMVFITSIGFSDLINKEAADSRAKNYALFISDTVVVGDYQTPTNHLTTKRRKLNKIMILLRKEDESDEEESEEEEENTRKSKNDNDVIITEALRGGTRRRVLEDRMRQDQYSDEKRRQHQKELLVQLNEAGQARLSKTSGGKVETKVKKSIIAYKSSKEFPRENEIGDLKIYVDKKNETVILPIFGIPVPFHISTIKNVSTSVEGDYLYLRINFFFPGSTLEKGSVFASNEATFLKEVTYRSYALKEQGEVNSPAQNLNDSFVTIKTVQKKYKTRVDEEKELEGVVKQDSLVMSATKVGPKLKDLYIRPNLYQKRISGSLEAHQNGFRFTSIKNDKVDIMYNNIKHAIYQPCDGEMIILLHFNLKNPIMLNKKKHFDIQFYTEVGEITTDLGKRQHMHDRDDYAAEAAERELRNKLKLAFKSFCDKIEATTKGEISFEIPLRELGFYGVPKKSNVLLQPTANALVNLTDPEPTVITLSDIELVHFERVSFQLKNFDIVIVFKDYNTKPLSITAVEMNKLEDIKNWLDKCDIKFTQGTTNLNWPALMKKITSDLEGFFNDGGWGFLDSDLDDDEEEDEEEEDDDQYAPSDDESEEDEEEESDLTEEESEVEESDDASMGSSEESGKSWSELEEEAAKADRNNRDYDDSTPFRRTTNGSSNKRKSYDDGRSGSKKRR